MACLLFTDIVDSTLLTERLGDARAAQFWLEHHRRARDLLVVHHGQEVDSSDVFFMLFDAIADAARYALAYHRTLADLGATARAGLHEGPVTVTRNSADDVARGAKRMEVQGLAKPFAARVMALAGGGQTLLSESARQALVAAAPNDVAIESHGHFKLKGVEEPVEIFELGQPDSAFAPPLDTDKVYRVIRSGEHWHPLREVRHNMAAERDAFVGRAAELRALAARLDAGARWLTVLGPGGIGKTRFVGRYARRWLGDWPGGVYFCDLSEARSLEGIFFVVASALEVPLGKNDPAVQLGHAIAGRGRCLIVLDNFEQVIEHGPATLGRWLDRSSEAAFVVTSRERLHLAGEEVLPLEPLPIASDAVDLFVARARAQRPDFALVDANRAAVAEVVRLLDGLPLAIELAAARSRVLSPAQLVEKMRDRFRILAGVRGMTARQGTLEAAIDWSWNLLAPWEQAAVAQCSVFEGGFSMEAAEAVIDLGAWPDAPSVMDVVQALVDKSMLRAWVPVQQGRFDLDEPYFGMYLSIHAYASAKLAVEAAATERTARAHGAYFARFGASDAIRSLSSHGGVALRRVLALELDNLVAACRRAVMRHEPEVALPCYRAVWCVLELHGPFALSVALGEQLLALPGLDAAMRSAAGMICGTTYWRSGHSAQAEAMLTRALDAAREAGARREEANLLNSLGNVQRETGRMTEASANFDRALEASREIGDRRVEAIVLQNVGVFLGEHGRIQEKRGHCEAALAIFREVGDGRLEGLALANLGMLHLEQGRMDEATRCFDTALAVNREVGNRRLDGVVFGCLGGVHADRGDFEAGRIQYEKAFVIARETGDRRSEGIALGNLGEVHSNQDRAAQARGHFAEALAIARETGHRRHEGFLLGRIASLDVEAGRHDDARGHLDAALAIHRDVGDTRLEGIVLATWADLVFALGQRDEARDALIRGEALLRAAGDTLEIAKLLCVRGRTEAADGLLDAARATLAEAEASAASIGTGPGSALRREIDALARALPA